MNKKRKVDYQVLEEQIKKDYDHKRDLLEKKYQYYRKFKELEKDLENYSVGGTEEKRIIETVHLDKLIEIIDHIEYTPGETNTNRFWKQCVQNNSLLQNQIIKNLHACVNTYKIFQCKNLAKSLDVETVIFGNIASVQYSTLVLNIGKNIEINHSYNFRNWGSKIREIEIRNQVETVDFVSLYDDFKIKIQPSDGKHSDSLKKITINPRFFSNIELGNFCHGLSQVIAPNTEIVINECIQLDLPHLSIECKRMLVWIYPNALGQVVMPTKVLIKELKKGYVKFKTSLEGEFPYKPNTLLCVIKSHKPLHFVDCPNQGVKTLFLEPQNAHDQKHHFFYTRKNNNVVNSPSTPNAIQCPFFDEKYVAIKQGLDPKASLKEFYNFTFKGFWYTLPVELQIKIMNTVACLEYSEKEDLFENIKPMKLDFLCGVKYFSTFTRKSIDFDCIENTKNFFIMYKMVYDSLKNFRDKKQGFTTTIDQFEFLYQKVNDFTNLQDFDRCLKCMEHNISILNTIMDHCKGKSSIDHYRNNPFEHTKFILKTCIFKMLAKLPTNLKKLDCFVNFIGLRHQYELD